MSRAAGRERRSDRISGLTDELLLSILSELPIGDAAATAVLSKRWKDLFPSLPRFRIDFGRAGALPTFETVRSIICTRDSPLTSFHMQTTNEIHYGRFRQMVHSLSATGIQELAVSQGGSLFLLIPKCIFSCRTLKKIELWRCFLLVPSAFTGLPRLQHLLLVQFLFLDVGFDKILSCCSALKELVLSNPVHANKLEIRSNSLACLKVSANEPFRILIERAPLLAEVAIRFNHGVPEDQRDEAVEWLVALLRGLKYITSLTLDLSKEYSAIGASLPKSLPGGNRLEGLKKLFLKLQFMERGSAPMVKLLLRSAPNLEDLTIIMETTVYAAPSLEHHWDVETAPECVGNRLRTATLYPHRILRLSIPFVEFLLMNAGVLQKMTLVFGKFWIPTTLKSVQEKLRRVPKASDGVDIELITTWRMPDTFKEPAFEPIQLR